MDAFEKVANGQPKAASGALTKLEDGDSAVAASARLAKASIALGQGDKKAAIAEYAAISADKGMPDAYRDLALLRQTVIEYDSLSPDEVIRRMQQAQRRALAEIWEHRNPDIPVKTPEQLVTLASIVEKETGKPDERSRVAAVFVNRLRQKIKLQSDPTIIYGLVGGKGTLGRPIKRS